MHNMHSFRHAFHKKEKKQANLFFILYMQLKYHTFIMFISKPSSMEWSLIFICFHIEALCKCNGHRSFISRPSSMEWSLIFICFHIEALCKCNGHRSFISRPSSMEWSLIFICFHIEAL